MIQIVQRRLDEINSIIQAKQSTNNSFLSGRSAIVLYYFHLYEVTGNNEYRNKAMVELEEIVQNLQSGEPKLFGSSFSTGGAGFAWVVGFLRQHNFIDWNLQEEFAEFDSYLFDCAMNELSHDALDYLHGAMGILHYFTVRMNEEKIKWYADTLIEALNTKAICDNNGLRIYSYISKTIEPDKEEFNLSISHGLSGWLLILINAWHHSGKKEMIEKMIREGLQYILYYRKDADYTAQEYNFFPFAVNERSAKQIESPRLAWCYGDLNQVLLLNRAGKLLQEDNYLKLAQIIGLQTLMRKTADSTLATDSHFCHGTSGLAQFYKVLYDTTGYPAYKSGYNHWIEQTILHLEKELYNGKYAGKEKDFLEGLLGVAFTLLSYISDKKLRWSNSLLL